MKNQALFSSKDKSRKKIKWRLLQFLFGALRVKGTNLKVDRIFRSEARKKKERAV